MRGISSITRATFNAFSRVAPGTAQLYGLISKVLNALTEGLAVLFILSLINASAGYGADVLTLRMVPFMLIAGFIASAERGFA
mgnify:CR=1 FL=1